MIADICAYTNKVRTNTCNADKYATISAALKNTLKLAAWTEIGDNDYISSTSPNLGLIPNPLYKGKVRIKLSKDSNKNLQIQAGNEDFSVYHVNPLLLPSTESDYRVGGTYKIIACPYQFAMFLSYPQTAGVSKYGCLISSLQVPSFVQDKLLVIDSIIAIPIGMFLAHSAHVSGEKNFFLHFNSVLGGSHTRHYEEGHTPGSFGCLFYSVCGQTKYPNGDPLISPPFACWNVDNPSILATINGFLWDSIIIANQVTHGTTFFLDYHNWLVYSNLSSNGSLAFVTGGIG